MCTRHSDGIRRVCPLSTRWLNRLRLHSEALLLRAAVVCPVHRRILLWPVGTPEHMCSLTLLPLLILPLRTLLPSSLPLPALAPAPIPTAVHSRLQPSKKINKNPYLHKRTHKGLNQHCCATIKLKYSHFSLDYKNSCFEHK